MSYEIIRFFNKQYIIIIIFIELFIYRYNNIGLSVIRQITIMNLINNKVRIVSYLQHLAPGIPN